MNSEERADFVEAIAQAVIDRIELREKVNHLANLALKQISPPSNERKEKAAQEREFVGSTSFDATGDVSALNNGHCDHGQVANKRKVLLKHFLSPGDVLMLTAAVRDLALSHPGRFLIDVRTPCPELWENNPYITPLAEEDRDVEVIDCEYPLIHQSNQLPYHFIHAFRLLLEEKLGVSIRPHAFSGDIHLSDEEKGWLSQVDEITEERGKRFWIIVSGGKKDFTAKWWDPARYQAVVNHFQGRLQFVQVGDLGDYHVHPPLEGVINLLGKTDLRQLVRLVHHADGVICPVTMLMHLAAAVETKSGRPRNRSCVVVAGGREPSQWEAYPHHQFLHTNGSLPCCDDGGCWKSRVAPLGDEDVKDESLCLLPVQTVTGRMLPTCLDMVTAEDVIHAVERYLKYADVQQLQLL